MGCDTAWASCWGASCHPSTIHSETGSESPSPFAAPPPGEPAAIVQIGYHLSSEEQPPGPMMLWAARAEELGFDFLTISDHYHPWTRQQGESPFVWSVLGGL